MKKALSLLLALLLTSCATLTPEQLNMILTLAGQAAQIGTQVWIQTHPTQRTSFEISVAAFTDAVAKGDTNAVEFLTGLPTSTLVGPESALYVTGNRIVVWDESRSKAHVVTNLRPIVAGLRRGLAQAPPRLPTRRGDSVRPQDVARYFETHPHAGFVRTNSPYTLELNPGVPTNAPRHKLMVTDGAGWIEPPPLSDAELDAQFTAIKARLEARTNTVCEVDVQPTPNGASVLTVRWPERSGVYQVQQRDEGSVEWLTFGWATNAAAWSTPWHPALPLGHWRVVRQR